MPNIFCIVYGDNAAFPVTFDAAQTVGELKEAIKVKKHNMMANIDADELELYRLDIAERDREKRNRRIEEVLLKKPDPLYSTDEMGDLYPPSAPPVKGMIHILVILPQGESIIRSSACSVMAHVFCC